MKKYLAAIGVLFVFLLFSGSFYLLRADEQGARLHEPQHLAELGGDARARLLGLQLAEALAAAMDEPGEEAAEKGKASPDETGDGWMHAAIIGRPVSAGRRPKASLEGHSRRLHRLG